MLITLVRTALLYILVVITIRLMGKRQVAQLEPFELVITIMIAELAVIPMQDRHIPLINGVIAILTLLFIQVSFSILSLKFPSFRSVLDGRYSVIVANGVIQEKELRKARYNLEELLEQLRLKNIFDLGDVEFAILETSGELSVLLKSQNRPATPGDLQVNVPDESLPNILILDGRVRSSELRRAKLSEGWLRSEIEKYGAKDTHDVLFAARDTRGNFHCQLKDKARHRAKVQGRLV